MAWYVYEGESDDIIAGPFLSAEDAVDRAATMEASHIAPEVGWLYQPDIDDELDRQRLNELALDDDADAYFDR